MWYYYKLLEYRRTNKIQFFQIPCLIYLITALHKSRVFNTASRQDTAYDHINQMGDFCACIRFGRVLPPTTANIVWGSVDPPMGGYGVIKPQYKGEIAKSTPMLDRFPPIFG